MYEYYSTTGNKNFKCVSLEKYFIFEYYYLYYYYLMIFYFLYCSIDYEYFCTKGNKNLKRVSLEKYFILEYYYLYFYYLMIFYFLYWSIDYKYFCTTGDKNFKRVFLKSIFFNLTVYISRFGLTDWPWNLEIFTGCIFIAWTTDLKIWCFFLFLFTSQKTKKHKENRCFNFKILPFSLIFKISLFILY